MSAGLRSIAIAALAWTATSFGAAVTLGPPALVDLSHLEFAPSLAGGPPDPSHAPRAAQAVSSDRAGRRVLELVGSIAAEQENEGTFSPGLTSDLVLLASLYETLGDHIAAIAAAERARQVVRVNNGLSSLDQAEMLQLQIASLEAMGRYDTAARTRTTLAALAREAPDDLRTGAIYAAVADGRMASIERWFADTSRRPIIFGSGPSGDDYEGMTVHDLVRQGLTAVQLNYVDALRVTAIVGSPSGPDVHELETALLRTFYMQAEHRKLFFGSEITPVRFRAIMDKAGTNSYQRRVQYSRLFGRPAPEIARELVELGDWHLWFRADEAAVEAYRQAREELAREHGSPEDFDALFSPASPTLIPSFVPLLDTDGARTYMGWFDVAVALDAYGRSTAVRITNQSGVPPDALAAHAITRELKKRVAKTQFRPRFVSGERADRSQLALRYYFRY